MKRHVSTDNEHNSSKPNYITRSGLERIQRLYDKLVNEDMPRLLLRMKDAGQEDFENEQARRDLLVLEAHIKTLEPYLIDPVIIDDLDISTDKVDVGTQVTICELGYEDREVYAIVGEGESDPSQGRISWRSAFAEALLGKRVGEVAIIALPSGEEVKYKVLKIEKAFG